MYSKTANSIHQGANVLNHLVAASSSALVAIGGKLRGMLGQQQEPVQYPPDEETLRARERQSMRIKLRMLSHEGRLEELAVIAETTDDDETSRCAVAELDDATTNDTTLLERLARGRSRSTVRAIVRLYNRRQTWLAERIFLNHLKEGGFAELISRGSVKLFFIVDLLGVFETAVGKDKVLDHFMGLWQLIEPDPIKQNMMLAEMLGDPEPGGWRHRYEDSSVPQSVRLKALELLQLQDLAGCERACLYASSDDDPVVAHPAAVWLYSHWQGDGLVPKHIEPMAMLDINVLYQLCSITTSFKWNDAEQADELSNQWTQDTAELALPDEECSPERKAFLIERIALTEFELVHMAERRINRLQPLVDSLCAALRLPNAKLVTGAHDAAEASYCVGMGTIRVNRRNLLTDQPLSQTLMSALLHEICHMQQDVLIIRMICDELGIKFGEHSEFLVPLWDKYSDGVGYAPDSMFLLAVLRLREDQPLTEDERRRARRLWDDALFLNSVNEECKAVERRRERLVLSLEFLNEDTCEQQLLECLRDTHQLDRLFQIGQVPEVLLHELAYCRNAVDQLTQAWMPGTKDSIAFVQQLYQSEYKIYISPIVERLKHVLLEILGEELRILDKEISRLKRDGYQEAEAYLVTDRADVIIKGMRNGWFL